MSKAGPAVQEHLTGGATHFLFERVSAPRPPAVPLGPPLEHASSPHLLGLSGFHRTDHTLFLEILSFLGSDKATVSWLSPSLPDCSLSGSVSFLLPSDPDSCCFLSFSPPCSCLDLELDHLAGRQAGRQPQGTIRPGGPKQEEGEENVSVYKPIHLVIIKFF